MLLHILLFLLDFSAATTGINSVCLALLFLIFHLKMYSGRHNFWRVHKWHSLFQKTEMLRIPSAGNNFLPSFQSGDMQNISTDFLLSVPEFDPLTCLSKKKMHVKSAHLPLLTRTTVPKFLCNVHFVSDQSWNTLYIFGNVSDFPWHILSLNPKVPSFSSLLFDTMHFPNQSKEVLHITPGSFLLTD